MNQDHRVVAAVYGASSTAIQVLFREFVSRWQAEARIVGVIEHDHGLGERTCSAGQLRSIANGRIFPIFQDLGPQSTACHLEGSGATSASAVIEQDIAAGCDLVILSKFGKLEADRAGLAPALAAAIAAGVPVLTAVSPTFQARWAQFAAPLFETLPPDLPAIEAWWHGVRRHARATPEQAQNLWP